MMLCFIQQLSRISLEPINLVFTLEVSYHSPIDHLLESSFYLLTLF